MCVKNYYFLCYPVFAIRSKSKLNPAVKKPSIPRSGLVDALALPLPVTPSALTLSAASTPVAAFSVSKEIKKSQLKDRMSSAAAQPVARQDSNSVHHRSDSAPNLSSGKTEKFRTEVGMPSTRPDNGVKLENHPKHRQRPDPTCSAARTEIHHITKDPNKAGFRQSEISHSTNHSRITDTNQTNNSRSDHAAESVKPRSETTISKGNPVQVRSDLGIVKNDTPPSSRPNKVDSIKPRQDSNAALRGSEGNKQSRADNNAVSSDSKSSSVLRGSESNKQSRWENITPSELKNRFDHVQNVPKIESTQNKLDATPSDINSASSSKSGKNSKTTPAVGPSLANSLASFVDSGLRWTDPGQVLDLSDDQQQSRQMSKAVEPTSRADSLIVKDSVPKVEETEDQESLLQRDLAMVLEEISQITRLVENKDLSQPPQMTKSSDSRTKSVIKTTGSLSTSHSPASAPSLTPNPSSRQSMTSGSALPPKLTSATRTPPPPPLTVSTPVSRISNSPTGANTSVNLISPTTTHSSRTISPVSSDHLKSGEKI